MTNSLALSAALSAIETAGYAPLMTEDKPTIQCASEPLEFFSAPDWDSLSRYAMNYQLCECGRH